jgi:hypothetical protein
VLDGAGSRPNLLRSLGLRPLNAGAFLGLGLVAHQTYCEARAQVGYTPIFRGRKKRGCLETGNFLSEPGSRRSSPWYLEEHTRELRSTRLI